MSTPNPVPAVAAQEVAGPTVEATDATVEGPPTAEAVPAAPEPAADAAPAVLLDAYADKDPIPAEAEPDEAPPVPMADAAPETAPEPSSSVIVLETRRLKGWLGAFIGALIGAMLMGAIVVPFFRDGLLVVGIAAGIATIVALAWVGRRIAGGRVRDPG